jgi:hypothetical protein
MVVRSVPFSLLATLLLSTASLAGGVEPGSPLSVQPPRARPKQAAGPSPRSLSLSHFLDAPGNEEDRVKLWLRFNREARVIEEGARDFLETLILLTDLASKDVIYSHEHVQLDAESLAADQEIAELMDAREVLLEERGRGDPDHAILKEELAPPWSPEGVLDREALGGLFSARTGRAGPLGPQVERVLGRLGGVERRLDSVEHQLLPAAEESLGAALLALSSAEATVLEVIHGLHFLKHQQRARLELRVHRELLLMELARQAGCRVDQLPWVTEAISG